MKYEIFNELCSDAKMVREEVFMKEREFKALELLDGKIKNMWKGE